jgi:Spy/CpxP family protein refolding chaperone
MLDLVMQNQQEIGLQEGQRDAIRQEIQKAQSFFLDWQWKLAGEVEKLKKLVDAAPIDEVRALEQVDKVLAAEREIKRAQLALLIHIKNLLTDRQR